MWIDVANIVLLVTALSVMLAQTLFKTKRIEHILFAILCGSLAMAAIQRLSADSLGPYQYFIALGTCATCNAMWLVSRAMFRGENSISLRHFLFAGAIAGLTLMNRSIDLLLSFAWVESTTIIWVERSANEVTQFMSSTVLALTFWESIHGYNECSSAQKKQRLLFAATFITAVFTTKVIANGMLPETSLPAIYPWFATIFALSLICVTHTILTWQQHERAQLSLRKRPEITPVPANGNSTDLSVDNAAKFSDSEDITLLIEIEQLMTKDKLYLQSELKMIDIANRLNVSEYKVSRAIRSHSQASNFNHFVNSYRLAHAKQLLTTPHNQHWTILVISLESGFASLAPFNRAFKAQEGCTPNQYRNKHTIVAAEQAYL